MERVEFTVKGMTCEHCVTAVTNALKAVQGVQAAEVNLAEEWARVTYDSAQTNIEALRAAVSDAGYQAL